jgi:hypothetical protein
MWRREVINLNQILAQYLREYGDYIREHGQDVEFRGIQRELNDLASLITELSEEEAIRHIGDMLEELHEMQAVWG